MAVVFWRLGISDDPSTKVSIVIKSDDGLSYDWIINGNTRSISTTGGDNIGMFEETGLTPETVYSFTVAGVSGSIRTFPESGKPVRLMGTNCYDKESNFLLGKIVEERQPALFMWQGDNGYSHHNGSFWGVACTPLTVGSTGGPPSGTPPVVTDYHHHYEAFQRVPGVSRINQQFMSIALNSNHEMGGDTDDHTPLSFGSGLTQDNANICYARGVQALNDYNPELPFELETTDGRDIPEAVLASTFTNTNYDPRWYKFTCGMVEVFVIDCIGGKSRNIITDVGNLMLGTSQEAWLIREVNASSATWKAIIHAQAVHGITRDPDVNTNGWHQRQTQLNRIVNAFTTTGIIWIGADWHAVSLQTGDSQTDQYAACNMGAGGSRHNMALSALTPRNVHDAGDIKYGGDNQRTRVKQSTVGQYDFTSDRLTVTGLNAQGETLITVSQLPTKNVFEDDIRSLARSVDYEHTITESSHCGYDDPTLVWQSNSSVIHVTGFVPGPVLDGGLAFQLGISPGEPLAAAELEISMNPFGLLQTFRIWMEPAGVKTETPYGTVGNLPRQTADFTTFVQTISTPSQYGIIRVDVTEWVQALVNDPSYTTTDWANFGLLFANSNDDIFFDGVGVDSNGGNSPRLFIQFVG